MRKKVEWNRELWIAVVINLVFVFFYACFCLPYYETSDDNGMAFFVEGAYGSRTGHLVFENIIWGKFLSLLSAALPGIKWYTVIMYAGMFCAYVGISYFMLRVGGRRAGFVNSIFLLVILGMGSYVVFQWTRVAAILTIGGMLLLFYSIEYAEDRGEQIAAFIMGFALCIFGGLVRFQFFCCIAVLSGGIILIKLMKIIKEQAENWKKRLGVFVLVFGSVALVNIAVYGADKLYYLKDESWRYYQEYNYLRSQLWDYGFPDYVKNRDLYESLGISANDMDWYYSWNMDEELMSIETMRALVQVKEERRFSGKLVKNYLKDFCQSFLGMPLFGIFLLVSMISIVLNKKNFFLVLYEVIAIMVFQLYFYYSGRFGQARIDMGMLASGIVVIMCAMSEGLRRITFKLRWVAVLACACIFLNMSTWSGRIFYKIEDNAAREFFDMLSEDKDNIYCMVSALKEPYNLLTNVFDFWEPIQEGSLSNCSYMSGWDFNVPVKKALLAKYGISNIYRDSIDNDNVCLVANDSAEKLERYIQENYNKEVSLCLLKDIESCKIWGARSRDVYLDGKINENVLEIKHKLKVKKKGRKLKVSGYAYKRASNSFQQRAYLKLKDLNGKKVIYRELTMSNLENCTELMNGKYSKISGSFEIRNSDKYEISIILKADGELYELPVAE